MKPIVHGLEAQYTDRMVFTYVDIDDPQAATVKAALGFRAQPQFVLLDGQGQVLKTWFGFVEAADFEAAFAAALQ